jgi:hypothetical protein
MLVRASLAGVAVAAVAAEGAGTAGTVKEGCAVAVNEIVSGDAANARHRTNRNKASMMPSLP